MIPALPENARAGRLTLAVSRELRDCRARSVHTPAQMIALVEDIDLYCRAVRHLCGQYLGARTDRALLVIAARHLHLTQVLRLRCAYVDVTMAAMREASDATRRELAEEMILAASALDGTVVPVWPCFENPGRVAMASAILRERIDPARAALVVCYRVGRVRELAPAALADLAWMETHYGTPVLVWDGLLRLRTGGGPPPERPISVRVIRATRPAVETRRELLRLALASSHLGTRPEGWRRFLRWVLADAMTREAPWDQARRIDAALTWSPAQFLAAARRAERAEPQA